MSFTCKSSSQYFYIFLTFILLQTYRTLSLSCRTLVIHLLTLSTVAHQITKMVSGMAGIIIIFCASLYPITIYANKLCLCTTTVFRYYVKGPSGPLRAPCQPWSMLAAGPKRFLSEMPRQY